MPVGPLDKDALRSTVNALAGQGPDADRALAAGGAGRSRHRGGAAQRGPGHRRRRQLRAAGPVQGGARGGQARRRDVDLGRRLPGQRPRAQAAALHRRGRRRVLRRRRRRGQAGRRAARRCSRAPSAPTSRRAPRSRAGPRASRRRRSARACSSTSSRPRRGARWFSIDVPEGRRAIVSATAIPARGSDGTRRLPARSLQARRRRHAGDGVRRPIRGATFDDVYGATTSLSVRSVPGDPPGTYAFSVQIEHLGGEGLDAATPGGDRRPVPRAGGDTSGLVSAPGELATPTPDADARQPSPRATAPRRGRRAIRARSAVG